MCPTVFEIQTLSPLHAAAVAAVLATLMVAWAWREARAGRLTAKEYRESVAVGAGMALLIGVALFIASRFVHPIRIRSYGVMLMLAFAVGILIASQRARLYRVDPIHIIDLSLFVLVGSIVGARAFYVLLNWQADFAGNPRTVLNMWEGGLAFYGGLGGGTLGGLLFCRWRRIRLRVLADLVAPSIAFGYAVARLGCFLNGCCHGGPTHSALGVVFPMNADLGPVHPAQLYSAFMSWVVGVALLVSAPRIRAPGHLMLWYLVLSSVERIITEVFRHGYTGVPLGFLPALTQAQGLSILIIVFAAGLIYLTRGRVGYPLPEEEGPGPSQPQAAAAPVSAEAPGRRRGRRGKKGPRK